MSRSCTRQQGGKIPPKHDAVVVVVVLKARHLAAVHPRVAYLQRTLSGRAPLIVSSSSSSPSSFSSSSSSSAGLARRLQRSWLLSSHDNQHDTPSFLKSLLNFFVAKREKRGVDQTMSHGERGTIAVKRHYRPRTKRLNGIEPQQSGSANNA